MAMTIGQLASCAAGIVEPVQPAWPETTKPRTPLGRSGLVSFDPCYMMRQSRTGVERYR